MDCHLGSSIGRPILTLGFEIVASVRDAAAGQRLTVRIIRLAPENGRSWTSHHTELPLNQVDIPISRDRLRTASRVVSLAIFFPAQAPFGAWNLWRVPFSVCFAHILYIHTGTT